MDTREDKKSEPASQGASRLGATGDGGPVRKFEISNPSDKCFLHGTNLAALSMATLMLGAGFYGLHEVGGEFSMPLFLGTDPSPWFKETFGATIAEYLDAGHETELAEALESFAYAGKRTSLNNIGARAKAMAEACRAKAAERSA